MSIVMHAEVQIELSKRSKSVGLVELARIEKVKTSIDKLVSPSRS
jgi:hypothetical protein